MLRRAFFYLLVIGCLAYLLALLVRYEPPSRVPLNPETFAVMAERSANHIRAQAGLVPLQPSQQLLGALQEYVDQGGLGSGRLDDVFDHVEQTLPQVHELAVNLVYDRAEDAILHELERWEDLAYAQHTHYATWVFRDSDRNAIGCLAVLARELPQLKLPVRTDDPTPAYFDTCRLCGQGHGVSLARHAQNTLIVTCPHCQRPYNLIATDASGWWRRANQFFGGAPLPELDEGLSKMDELLAIWADVAAKCQYKTDAQRVFGSDSWELPIETYRNGHGDCEDTSLLLAELLIERGFEARVALGKHDNDGHAWCVVRLDGVSYLLESTWENIEALSRPPKLEELAMEYEPKYLFDRESLYFLRQDDWTGDYWSEKRWLRVPYEAEAPVETEVAHLAPQSQD